MGGGGGLYEIDPEKNSYSDAEGHVVGGWNNADFMVGCGDFLYIICNRGDGGMYKVNPTDSKPNSNDPLIKHGWKNATAMTQLNGKIYVICGKGGGGLYEVDPEKNSYSDAEGHVVGGWHNADFFCSISGGGKANDGIRMDTKPLYVLEERDFAFDVGHYGDAIKLNTRSESFLTILETLPMSGLQYLSKLWQKHDIGSSGFSNPNKYLLLLLLIVFLPDRYDILVRAFIVVTFFEAVVCTQTALSCRLCTERCRLQPGSPKLSFVHRTLSFAPRLF